MSYSDGPSRRKKPKPETKPKPITAKIMTDEEYRAALEKRDQQLRDKAAKTAPKAPPALHPFASKFAISIERMHGRKEKTIKLRDIVAELALQGGDPKAEGWYDLVSEIGTYDFGLRQVTPGAFPTVWEMPSVTPTVQGGKVTRKAVYSKALPGRILEDIPLADLLAELTRD